MIYNEKLKSIVSRLDKVIKTGNGYRARCPVHGSKGQTLSITAKDGGYIVAHCFSCGAGGPELMKALDLPVGFLFPETTEYAPPTITKQMKADNARDGTILQYAQETPPETLADNKEVTKARERVKGYFTKAEQANHESPPITHPALTDFAKYKQALETAPALREQIVAAHWEGVAVRAELWLLQYKTKV